MSTELTPISNDELLALTGEDQQMGGTSVIKFVKLVQEIKNGAAERYGNLIAMEKDPLKKKELQSKMLEEMDSEIKVGCFSIKNGQDEFGNDVVINLGNPFIAQILKVRYSWATKYGNVNPMYTSEVDTPKAMVKIFKDKKEIDMLPGEMIKTKYPELKRADVLYLYDKDTSGLWKLTVKGGSLTGWFDFRKTFPYGVSQSSFETIFGSKLTTDPNTGKEYYAMTFARGSQIEDMRKTIDCLRDLNGLLGTNRISKNLTPPPVREDIAALAAPLDSFDASISVSSPRPAAAQTLIPKAKERRKMIQDASDEAVKRADKESESMPPGFLQPDNS